MLSVGNGSGRILLHHTEGDPCPHRACSLRTEGMQGKAHFVELQMFELRPSGIGWYRILVAALIPVLSWTSSLTLMSLSFLLCRVVVRIWAKQTSSTVPIINRHSIIESYYCNVKMKYILHLPAFLFFFASLP
jgi:hypothetical protein